MKMFSKLIHVVTFVRFDSFLWPNTIALYECMCFVYLSVDGHLGCIAYGCLVLCFTEHFMQQLQYGHLFSFLLNVFMELLGHVVLL